MLMRAARHISHGRQGLEHSQREGAGFRRHDLGDQRHAHGELAAHPEAREEPIQGEVPEADRDRTESREKRVEQDRDKHRPGAAEQVAHDAKDDASGSPPDEEDGRGITGILRHQIMIVK